MARGFIDIETTPYGEDCAQVSNRIDYMPRMHAEAVAYRHQLQRMFPAPGNAFITIKSNPHDFGSYLSLRLRFDDESEEETTWAYWVESEGPEHWDADARAELAAAGFPVKKST